MLHKGWRSPNHEGPSSSDHWLEWIASNSPSLHVPTTSHWEFPRYPWIKTFRASVAYCKPSAYATVEEALTLLKEENGSFDIPTDILAREPTKTLMPKAKKTFCYLIPHSAGGHTWAWNLWQWRSITKLCRIMELLYLTLSRFMERLVQHEHHL